jgi:hypothetical protein
MMVSSSHEVTCLLQAWNRGDRQAPEGVKNSKTPHEVEALRKPQRPTMILKGVVWVL